MIATSTNESEEHVQLKRVGIDILEWLGAWDIGCEINLGNKHADVSGKCKEYPEEEIDREYLEKYKTEHQHKVYEYRWLIIECKPYPREHVISQCLGVNCGTDRNDNYKMLLTIDGLWTHEEYGKPDIQILDKDQIEKLTSKEMPEDRRRKWKTHYDE